MVWGTDKRAETTAADAHVTSRAHSFIQAGLGGQELERGRPGVCVEGWWPAYGEPLVAKSPELGFIPTQPPSKGGAFAPLVVSANFAHLCVWEMGWGTVPLNLCGVLVRESRATWLDGAHWGLSPGLYR